MEGSGDGGQQIAAVSASDKSTPEPTAAGEDGKQHA